MYTFKKIYIYTVYIYLYADILLLLLAWKILNQSGSTITSNLLKEHVSLLFILSSFTKWLFSASLDFLGRTEVPVATIKKEMNSKGAATRRLLLHEVATGEVWVKLDLQLYEPTRWHSQTHTHHLIL